MPLNYSFFADAGETPQTLEERRRRADLLASQIGGGTANVGEGIGDLFRGIGSGLSRYRTNKMQKKGEAGARSGMDKLMSIMYGNPANQNADYTAGQPGDVLARASQSIAGIESGGDYSALGPTTRTGDRAYGKYQVMGANIPEWTEAATGQRLTPEEFLAMPKAQEAVFNHRFGGYLKENSPEDAASMWFTGKPLAEGAGLTDQLGTSGQGYADQFNAGMGGGGGMPMVPQLATYTPPQPQPAGAPMGQAPQMPPQGVPAPQGPAPMAPAPVADMAQMQPASADSAMIPQIMEMLRNPFVSDQDKAFLQQRLQDIQQKQDPAYKMGLEKSKIELDRLRDPSKTPLTPIEAAQLAQIRQEIKNGNIKEVNGRLIDVRTGKAIYESPPDAPKPSEPFTLKGGETRYDGQGNVIADVPQTMPRPATAEEKKLFGVDPDTPLVIGEDGKPSILSEGGVNIDLGDNSFDKELGKGIASVYTGQIEQGNNAVATKAGMQQFRQLMAGRGGALDGFGSVMAPYLPEGMVPEGANDVTAAQAIVSGLIPKQRVAGSGTTSDFDARQFAKSLPSVWNKPGANELIADTFEAYSDYQIAISGIIQEIGADDQVKNKAKAINQAVRALPDPFVRWKEYIKNNKNPSDAVPTPEKSDLEDALKQYGPKP